MALTFTAGTGYVDVPSAPAISSLANFTILAWIVWLSTSGAQRLMAKGDPGNSGWEFSKVGNAGAVSLTVYRTGANDDYVTSTAVMAPLVTHRFLAVTYDATAGPLDRIHIYHRGLESDLAEAAYESRIDGTGGTSDDSAFPLMLGNRGGRDRAFNGTIGSICLIGQTLSQAEIAARAMWMRQLGPCLGLWHLGFSGAATQTDWSGHRHTGASGDVTVVGHEPLPPPFGIDDMILALGAGAPPTFQPAWAAAGGSVYP